MNKFKDLFHIKKYFIKYNKNSLIGFSSSFIELINRDPVKTAQFWIKNMVLLSNVSKTIEVDLDFLKLQRKSLNDEFDNLYSKYKSTLKLKKESELNLQELNEKIRGLSSLNLVLKENINKLENEIKTIETLVLTSEQFKKLRIIESTVNNQIKKLKDYKQLLNESVEIENCNNKLRDLISYLKEVKDKLDTHIKNSQIIESNQENIKRSKEKEKVNNNNLKAYIDQKNKELSIINEYSNNLNIIKTNYEKKQQELLKIAEKVKDIKKNNINLHLQNINQDLIDLNFDIFKNIDVEKLKTDIILFKKGLLNIFNESTTGFDMVKESDKNIYNYNKFHNFINTLQLFDVNNSTLNGILNNHVTSANAIKFKNFEFLNMFLNIYIKDFAREFETLINLEKQFISNQDINSNIVYLKEMKAVKYKLSLLIFNIIYQNVNKDTISFHSKGLAPKGLMTIKNITDYDTAIFNIFIRLKDISLLRIENELKSSQYKNSKMDLFKEFFKTTDITNSSDKIKTTDRQKLKDMVITKNERMKEIDDKMKIKLHEKKKK